MKIFMEVVDVAAFAMSLAFLCLFLVMAAQTGVLPFLYAFAIVLTAFSIGMRWAESRYRKAKEAKERQESASQDEDS